MSFDEARPLLVWVDKIPLCDLSLTYMIGCSTDLILPDGVYQFKLVAST